MDMTKRQEQLGPRWLPTVRLGGKEYFVEACVYGCEYYELEDAIVDILLTHGVS